ncbi:MAG: DUF4347 domain-containing protein [Sulfurimonas sp.]|jgi:hypothetical protein|uniref:DUF4347 domain-containing protein n=1 Tax=Sulfurimonas sp. TaxID=2022749 RepID=UPI0035692A55
MNVIDNRISFVLDNVSGYQTIVDNASLNSSVFVLDSTKDVLSQIAAITAKHSSLDSIHLFSHGSSGSLDLGNITLDNQTLQNYHEILTQIGTSLNDNGDILLYGCNVAEGQSGVEFINKLSQATGADIAASDDLTGNSAKGGNWILETANGSIETSSITASGFGGVLAPSGSPVYDFEGPTTQVNPAEVTFSTSGHTLDITSNSGVSYTSNSGLNYLNASTGGVGQIHLHFADGETFNAVSLDLREMVGPESPINMMITSNLTDRGSLTWTTDDATNQEMYIFHNNGTLNDSTFSTIDMSMFQGATDIYIEGWSGSSIEGIHIDNFTVDFPAVNTAPVINYLDGDSVSIAQGESAVIDANQMTETATITDSDSANLDGGYLNIYQTSGDPGNFSSTESALLFGASGQEGVDTPSSASTTPATGNSVYVLTIGGWIDIGTVDEGYMGSNGQNGASLEIYFNENATPNYASIILQTLQYSSDTAGTRTFGAMVGDGVNAPSNASIFTVEVTAASTPPTISDLNNDSHSSYNIFGGFIDASENAIITGGDGDFTGGHITLIPVIGSAGSYYTNHTLNGDFNGGNYIAFGASHDLATPSNGAEVWITSDWETFTKIGVVDGEDNGISGNPLTIHFTNDNNNESFNPAAANIASLLNSLKYNMPEKDGTRVDFTTTLNDGTDDSAAVTSSVTYYDPTPTLSYVDTLDDVQTGIEGGTYAYIDLNSNAEVTGLYTGAFNLDYNPQRLLIQASGAGTATGNFAGGESEHVYFGGTSGDMTGANLNIAANEYVWVYDSSLESGSQYICVGQVSSYSATQLHIEFTENISFDRIETLIRSIQYSSDGGVVDFSVNLNGHDDSGNAISATGGSQITFGSSNTAPENTISATYTTNEDTVKTITDLAVADTDGDTVTVTLSVDSGSINLPNINTATNITVIDANGLDGSISFSGGADDINFMLDGGVDFYPMANGTDAVTLTMTTSDGNGGSDTDTATISVTAINDAPTFGIASGFWDDFSQGLYEYYTDYFAESYASALQPDGKLVMVGYAEMEDGDPYLAIVRINADGTLDEDFADSGELALQGYYGADSVAIQPDGKILVRG